LIGNSGENLERLIEIRIELKNRCHVTTPWDDKVREEGPEVNGKKGIREG